MKPSQIPTLLVAAASAVSAQDYNQTAGFTLSLVDATNATLNGYGVSSCHAGAAIEALCLGPASPGAAYSTYYLNYTQYNNFDGQPTGPLVWNLPVTGPNGPELESEALYFEYEPGSNVATALFFPSQPNVYVGFDADNKLFVLGGVDDSSFSGASFPNVTYTSALYHWQACYTYTEGYYYFSLAWLTAGSSHNPTCTAVNVTRTFV